MFYSNRPGWNVETTHDPETEAACGDAIDPTVAFAADWGSTAHQHRFTDADGIDHAITVRKVVEPVEP